MANFTTLPIVIKSQIHRRKVMKILAIEECKKILEKGVKKYTYEEVKEIRKVLYRLAHIDYELYITTQNEIKKTDAISILNENYKYEKLSD